MKSTSMATNPPTPSAENRGSFVAIQKNVHGPTHIQKQFVANLRWNKLYDWMENQIGLNTCTKPACQLPCFQIATPIFASLDPILRFVLPEKVSFPYCQPPLLYIWGERSYLRPFS